MKTTSKSTNFTLILGAFLLLMILQTPSVLATELNGKERSLALLSDVAMLDLGKYNVTLRTYYVTYPSEYGGVPQERVHYILETSESELDATVVLRNGALAYCLLSWHSGSPIYVQPQPAYLVDAAKGVIERYQTYTSSSRFQEMRAILDLVDTTESTTATVGNLKLEVRVGNTVGFSWNYMFENAERTALDIVFKQGTLQIINDQWSIFTVSDVKAEISREKAIDIAVNRASTFSYTANGIPVSGFTIDRVNSVAELGLNARGLVLYPFWRVDLALDKFYPGEVSIIAVGVWGDTGDVAYIEELSYGGGDTPPSPTHTTETIAIVTATAGIVATTATALYIKKKRK